MMGAMSARSDRVVIVGAGLAGVCVARGLRKRGHTGPVLLLGGESHAPYDRPPLSKQYLLDGNEDTL
jgi:3-phenylpropionate/trans-cinnamate dioxygenase ferredoxin reductase subunit